MTKDFSFYCLECSFDYETNCFDKGKKKAVSHQHETGHDIRVKRKGYGYIVYCRDCGWQQVENNKELAEGAKGNHRMTHYGHRVRIKRKAWANKGSWDLTEYLKEKEENPHKKHNGFAMSVIKFDNKSSKLKENVLS